MQCQISSYNVDDEGESSHIVYNHVSEYIRYMVYYSENMFIWDVYTLHFVCTLVLCDYSSALIPYCHEVYVVRPESAKTRGRMKHYSSTLGCGPNGILLNSLSLYLATHIVMLHSVVFISSNRDNSVPQLVVLFCNSYTDVAQSAFISCNSDDSSTRFVLLCNLFGNVAQLSFTSCN